MVHSISRFFYIAGHYVAYRLLCMHLFGLSIFLNPGVPVRLKYDLCVSADCRYIWVLVLFTYWFKVNVEATRRIYDRFLGTPKIISLIENDLWKFKTATPGLQYASLPFSLTLVWSCIEESSANILNLPGIKWCCKWKIYWIMDKNPCRAPGFFYRPRNFSGLGEYIPCGTRMCYSLGTSEPSKSIPTWHSLGTSRTQFTNIHKI